ncbi:MAG: NusG domain II-containing protein [Clostridia bacterium]|nr:NusG domain II-containing protein [Clostridia bacterium]
MRKNKVVNDILLILGILSLALAIFLVFKLNLKNGNLVKVTVDNQVKHCYNINKDTEVVINNGKNTNMLVIKNGTVYISEANCPDKICVAHRAISKIGETIVCLPHKLVVEITEE